MSDSEDDHEVQQPKAKRQKRFRFKTFAQRVADVDVDVYRSLGPKRAEPLPGASSFFQEHLNRWRELNSAADFTEAAAALQPLVLTLPQLVHHKEEVLRVLMDRLHMGAALSLEPLLDLLGTLSRDLQQDYLPFVPRVFAALADLVDEGAEREPELLEHVFGCLSLLCKHLVKLLAPDPLPALRAAARLRLHAAPHVRALAARALGFLLRQAPAPALRAALRLALREAARAPAPEHLDGAGALVAEAVVGVGHGLHSRAGAVLGLVLGEGLLRPQDFKAKLGGAAKLTSQDIEGRIAAATAAALDKLLDHVRRGKCEELWRVVLAEVNHRLDQLAAVQSGGAVAQPGRQQGARGSQAGGAALERNGSESQRGQQDEQQGQQEQQNEDTTEATEQQEPEQNHSPSQEAATISEEAARASAARALALLCRMVEYYRGSRVESYDPLFRLAARVTGPEVWGSTPQEHGSTNSSRGSGGELAGGSGQLTGNVVDDDDVEALVAPSLRWQALRLLLALAHSHARVAGASAGPAAIEKAAPRWAGVFIKATSGELLPFIRGLIRPPGGPEVARFLGSQLLGALGRCLMEGVAPDVCWPLLIDACALLSPSSRTALPILLTASGCGRQLGAWVRDTARLGAGSPLDANVEGEEGGQAAGGSAAVRAAWAALQCLPHACESSEQALACCEALVESTQSALSASAGAQHAQRVKCQDLLLLHCSARVEHAALLAQHAPSQAQGLVVPALSLVRECPGDYLAVHATAAMLQRAQQAGLEPLPTEQMQELLPALAPNLSQPSSALRRETLRLLCAFRQPPLQAPAGAEQGQQAQQASEVLPQLLAIETRQLGMDSGRPAVVTLGRVRNYLEYRRLPEWLVPAVVHELLGVLHIRFSLLWPAAGEALATAFDTYPALSWPLMLGQLSTAQAAFLAGDIGPAQRGSGAPAPPAASDPSHGADTPPASLQERFAAQLTSGAGAAAGGSTDAAVRLNQLLRALSKAKHAGVEAKAKDWLPLFLAYCGAKAGEGGSADAEEEGEEEEVDGDEQHTQQAAAGAEAEASVPAEEQNGLQKSREGGHLATTAAAAAAGSPAAVSARAWRGGLREWLAVLGGLRGVRGMWGGAEAQRAVAAQLLSPDPALQLAALKCLKAFRFKFILPYHDSLARLADNKTLRAELAAFPLAPRASSTREGDGVAALAPEHRPGLVPLLIRLLYPKMRKRSGRLGGKGAPGSARAAILNFLSACPPAELRPLLELFLDPLSNAFVRQDGAGDGALATLEGGDDPDCLRLTEVPWWGLHLGREGGAFWLRRVDGGVLAAQPLRRRVGYLNTLEDLLTHLGHSIKPYLPELCSLVLCLLEGAMQQAEQAAQQGAEPGDELEAQGRREVRTRCLRLLAAVLERFPDGCEYSFLWQRLLTTVAPLLPRIPVEASSDRAPALLQLAASLAASPLLVPLLADCQTLAPGVAAGTSAAPASGDAAAAAAAAAALEQQGLLPSEEPWAAQERLGSRLLAECIAALSAPHCSEPTRGAMLGALESIFDLPDPLGPQLLAPHLGQLLAGLQAIVVAVWRQAGGPASKRLRSAGARGRGAAGASSAPRRATAKRALAILELVGSRVGGWGEAAQLTGALLPLVQPREGGRGKGRHDEELASRTLAVLAALWERLGARGAEAAGGAAPASEPGPQGDSRAEELSRVAGVLAPLAGSLEGREARAALCRALAALGGLLPALAPAAAELAALNAMSTTQVDEPDYDARIAAYSQLTPDRWRQLSQVALAPLVHQGARDLRNGDDLALRHAASQALSRLLEGAGASPVDDSGPAANDAAGPAVLGVVAQRVLFPQLKKGLAAPNLAVRQEHLSLLRQLALAFPAHYADLAALADPDPEVDFFLNVAHLQLHRRARSLARFAKALHAASGAEGASDASASGGSPPLLSVGSLVGVVVPLLQLMIVEGRGSEDSGHEVRQADKDRGANVADAAVGALGAVAQALPWVQYQQLLGQFMRLMKKHADVAAGKPVIRSVCAILDSFHFLEPGGDDTAEAAESDQPAAAQLPAVTQATASAAAAAAAAAAAMAGPTMEATGAGGTTEAAETAEGAEADDEEGEGEEMEEDGVTEAVEGIQVPREEVYCMLLKRVIPEMRRQLVVKNESVRAPVALALVKVLRLLPQRAMRLELPRVLQGVANLLKGRMQSTRDDARAVLVSMSRELGPDYLPFVCDVLSSALPLRGYTAQVLGYTLHAVVEGVVREAPAGALDDSLPLILPMIEADLFGDVAEAKEVSEFAGAYKEAKKARAYDTYRLLASNVTFASCIAELLGLVQARLGDASHPKTRAKLAALLQHAQRGVLANPTTAPRDLAMFVFATADVGLAAEEEARERASAAAGAATAGAAAASEDKAGLHQHLLVEFALTLLHGALKKGLINPRGPESAPLLDPLLPLLVRALRSRHAPSVSAALRTLTILIQCPLPGLDKAAPNAGKAVTDLLKRCPRTSHPIAQDCFRLLGGMLRQCAAWQPASAQLRFLLGWAFTDLEETVNNQNAFHLLKAILGRRLVVPEVYDLMGRVQELMVRSQAAPVRAVCSSALLQFLLDYPLGDKRLREHLEFLVSNLGYEHETGREAALDFVTVLVNKFPEQLVAQWSETVFLPLVARLVNDPSSKCRAMVGAALRALLLRLPPPRRDRLVLYCSQWLAGQDARLKRAAAQVLGILAEVEGGDFGRRVAPLLPALGAILAHAAKLDAQLAEGAEEDAWDDAPPGVPGWQEAYYTLVLLQKVLDCAPEQLAWGSAPAAAATAGIAPSNGGAGTASASGAGAQRCWRGARRLLLHRHLWVRKAAARLLGAGLAAERDVAEPMLAAGEEFAAGALALDFFRQLESQSADDALAGQAVKCLVYLAPRMYCDDEAAGRVPPPPPLQPSPLAGPRGPGGEAAAVAAVNGEGESGEAESQAVQNLAAAGANGHEAEAEVGPPGARETARGRQPVGDLDSGDARELFNDSEAEAEAEAEAGAASLPGVEEGEEEGEEEAAALHEEQAAGVLSLHGLVRRMVRLADDKAFTRQLQRGTALRFAAALASRLGRQRVLPYLAALMQPLYRITEPGATGNSEEVRTLADEVMAHLRGLVGADALLAAYQAARGVVRRQRGDRKRAAAVQALVDPEAAAKRKQRTQQRKAAGRKRQMEEVRRLRSAGVVVKNKKQRGGGGRE